MQVIIWEETVLLTHHLVLSLAPDRCFRKIRHFIQFRISISETK
jgi:hypothetical protein